MGIENIPPFQGFCLILLFNIIPLHGMLTYIALSGLMFNFTSNIIQLHGMLTYIALSGLIG